MKIFYSVCVMLALLVMAWAGVAPAHAAPMPQAPDPGFEWSVNSVTTGVTGTPYQTSSGSVSTEEIPEEYKIIMYSTFQANDNVDWLGTQANIEMIIDLTSVEVWPVTIYWYTTDDYPVQVLNASVQQLAYASAGKIELQDQTVDSIRFRRSWPATSAGFIGSSGNAFDLHVSAFPLSDCDEFTTLITEDFTIDPAIEFPVGSPTDEQMYETEQGQYYKLALSGEWDDGTDTSNEAAISWDGVNWTPLVSLPAECEEQEESTGTLRDVWYLTASSTTFYIRANDTPGAFTDNTQGTSPFGYTIGISVRTGVTCESQYTYDSFEDVQGFIGVPSTDSDGVLANNAEQDLIVGEWYIVRWSYGFWKDGGAGEERRDLQYAFSQNTAEFTPLAGGSDAVWCVSSDGIEFLFQAQGENLYLRVNDSGNFSGNTGTPYYTLYQVAFERTPTGCETKFQLGDLIESGQVLGTQANGQTWAQHTMGSGNVSPGDWYVLDTRDGPWWQASVDPEYRYDMKVSEDGGDTWTPLSDWERPECNIETDTLGHRRVYFQVPEEGDQLNWMINLNNSSYLGFLRQGKMGWDLYGSTRMAAENLPDGSCDYDYDVGTVVDMGTVDAKDEDGESLSDLVSGEFYLIKIIGTEHGWREALLGDLLYDMQISDNDGSSWSDLPSGYGGVLCSQQVGDDLYVFVQPGTNFRYRLRVDSTTFTNNTGDMGFVVYPATPGQSVSNTCFAGMSMQILNGFEWIDVREEQGEALTPDSARFEEYSGGIILDVNDSPVWITGGVVAGRSYMVETPAGEGPWGSLDALSVQRWDIALTPDNGSTWAGFTPEDVASPHVMVDCMDYDPVGHRLRIKFTAQEGDVWKIRVNDTAGDFGDNSGNMAYMFYVLCDGMSCTGSLPNDSTTGDGTYNGNIQGGGNVCNLTVVRPGTFEFTEILSLGNYLASWIQYANLSVMRYMAWCDRHTNQILELVNSLRTKEPFASLVEMEQIGGNVRREMESYDWGENAGSGESVFDMVRDGDFGDAFMDRLFGSGRERSIWEGNAPVLDFSDTSLPPSYYACGSAFTDLLPSRLRTGVCFVSAYFIETGASFWIQLMIDISALIMAIMITVNVISDSVYLLTGVRYGRASLSESRRVLEREVRSQAAERQEAFDADAEMLRAQFGGRYRKNSDGSYSRR